LFVATICDYKDIMSGWAIEFGFVDQDGLTEEELEEIVAHYDVDGSGRFDKAEFMAAFKGDSSLRDKKNAQVGF